MLSTISKPKPNATELAILNEHLLKLARLHFAAVLKENAKSRTALGITEGEWLHLYRDDYQTQSIMEARLDEQLLEALGLDQQDYGEIHVTFGLGMCDVVDTNHPHDCLLLNQELAALEDTITGASLSAAAEAKLIAANTAVSLHDRINNFVGVVVGFALLV